MTTERAQKNGLRKIRVFLRRNLAVLQTVTLWNAANVYCSVIRFPSYIKKHNVTTTARPESGRPYIVRTIMFIDHKSPYVYQSILSLPILIKYHFFSPNKKLNTSARTIQLKYIIITQFKY